MKNIATKLVKIMSSCKYAQKDGKNKFHNYNYVSAANILEKVNDACTDNNVASIVSYKIVDQKEKATKSGSNEFLITVEATLNIIDGDSGESVSVIALGTGQDPGDKAIAKAQTMALKYAWMTTLNISTGDDPEADESVDQRNSGKGVVKQENRQQPSSTENHDAITEGQIKKLHVLRQKLNIQEAEFKKQLSTVFKRELASLKDLTKKEAMDAIDRIEAKVKEMASKSTNQ